MEQEIKRPATPAGRNIPRDLFLHLLAIVTLYWSAISFVALVWQFINNFFPDNLNYFYGDYSSLIRFNVSAIIIVFPVFIAVSYFLNKIYIKEYAVRESKIRKWLLYLTLFITALIIIGDLIFVINTFLSGEITTRFILKALSTILVAGIIFGYYLDDVRRETPTNLAKYFAWVVSVLVLAVVVESFILVGSPNTARFTQFDQQKIYDLQGIQSEIVRYWQSKEKLPATITDLNDPILDFIVPVDPQTQKGYEYTIIDSSLLSFQLCADFNRQGNNQNRAIQPQTTPKGGYIDNWQHSAGHYCFIRTIDKQLYPPYSKTK